MASPGEGISLAKAILQGAFAQQDGDLGPQSREEISIRFHSPLQHSLEVFPQSVNAEVQNMPLVT